MIMSTQEKIVSEFGYIAAFSNAGGSKLSVVENDAKFLTVYLLPVKIGKGVGETLYTSC